MIQLSQVISFFDSLRQCKGVKVFIHGSCADNSTTAFSDIDDFIIIDDFILNKNEIEFIDKELKEIEKKFLEIDPLQHHGHWKIFQSELADYNNSFIPLFILEDAICIIGEQKIDACINMAKTHKGLLRNIKTTLKNIDCFYEQYALGKLNIFELKRFVSSIVLIPPLLFQLKGKNYSKKIAVKNSYEIFSDLSLKLIQWSTDLRNNWQLIIERNEYNDFLKKRKIEIIPNFNYDAQQNSPVIDFKNYSKIKISKQIIDNFISDSMRVVDECTLQKKTIQDYDKAYKIIETFAIENNAIIIGKFGEIKEPSISDLDIFICFPDSIYVQSIERLNKIINSDIELSYIITHPPVCVSESMLPYVSYVHTLYNLKFTYETPNKKEYLLNNLNKDFIDKINLLWTFFIINATTNILTEISYVPQRELLHLIKNIYSSLDNINRILGIESNTQEKSQILRKVILNNLNYDRKIVENEFKKSYYELMTLINKIDNSNKQYHCIINRKFIIKSGNYNFDSNSSVQIFYMPVTFYKIYRDVLNGRTKDVNLKKYLETYEYINKISNILKTINPFLFLIPRYNQRTNVGSYKKVIYKSFSIMPWFLIKIILKK